MSSSIPPSLYEYCQPTLLTERSDDLLAHSFDTRFISLDAAQSELLSRAGAATMKNIEMRRDILANGGPDIKIVGNSANHASYDEPLNDGHAATERDCIGSAFGNGERVSGPTNPTYNEYYGGWYDKAFPSKP